MQKRSQATVEALLDATARLLVREGYARASTNRIAEVAGVSIGSLYQYYSNKESLVAALAARHSREMLELLREAMSAVASADLGTAVRELVRAMIDAHRIDPELHRILDEQVPRMGLLDEISAVDRETLALVRQYLETRRGEIRPMDLDVAASICVTSVEALTHELVVRRPKPSSTADVDFVDEVTRLIVGYLRPLPEA